MTTTFRFASSALLLAHGACSSAAETIAADPDAGVPDLSVWSDRMRADMALRQANFDGAACELHPDEACVGAAGERTLFHFSTAIANVGTADLALGAPSAADPRFVWSECHEHFHFENFAILELRDADGVVATSYKQAFCLVDTLRVDESPSVRATKRYHCGSQGVSRGWADVYHTALPCQFLDVTDVELKEYTLRVEIDPEGKFAEHSRANNVIELAVDLGDPALTAPTEACPELDELATSTRNRECGWTLLGEQMCEPGSQWQVGCASLCSVGECSGAPQLRVCDGSAACSFPAALGHADDGCPDGCPLLEVDCPASGRLAAYGTGARLDTAWSCSIHFVER